MTKQTDLEKLIDCLCGEALMSAPDLLNYLDDLGIVSSLSTRLEDCAVCDLTAALNHFRTR